MPSRSGPQATPLPECSTCLSPTAKQSTRSPQDQEIRDLHPALIVCPHLECLAKGKSGQDKIVSDCTAWGQAGNRPSLAADV